LIDADRRLTAVRLMIAMMVASVVVHLCCEEWTTTWPVETSAKGAHKSPSVFVAKSAVEQEIASSVNGHETIENISKCSQNGLFVRLRRWIVKNVVNERGSRGQLTNQEHDDDGNQRDGDADLVRSSAFLPIGPDDRLTMSHHLSNFLTLTHRMNQERIKHNEQRQWQQNLHT
jgi:hypothetical protein